MFYSAKRLILSDTSNADTRNLLSPMDDFESSKADTRGKPAKPAAKNTAPAKKRKALAKEKKEPAKGRPTSFRKRGLRLRSTRRSRGRLKRRSKRRNNYKE